MLLIISQQDVVDLWKFLLVLELRGRRWAVLTLTFDPIWHARGCCLLQPGVTGDAGLGVSSTVTPPPAVTQTQAPPPTTQAPPPQLYRGRRARGPLLAAAAPKPYSGLSTAPATPYSLVNWTITLSACMVESFHQFNVL